MTEREWTLCDGEGVNSGGQIALPWNLDLSVSSSVPLPGVSPLTLVIVLNFFHLKWETSCLPFRLIARVWSVPGMI